MRIARTTGVSDAIVKPRRGISLRPVREEPKPPEKIVSGSTFNLAKALKHVDTSARGAGRVIDAFAQVFADSMSPRTQHLSDPTVRFETEEVPEDRRRYRYNVADLRLQGRSNADMMELVNHMAGPVPEGYRRSVERHNNFTTEFIEVEDYRPRSVRRMPFVQATSAAPSAHVDLGEARGDIGIIEFRVPYEVLEDIDPQVMRLQPTRFDTMPMAFWVYVAERMGAGDMSGYTRVEICRNIMDRTISVIFFTR